ncbi:MAG: NifB/NifX family molybdenum-iron cluster-binding protein [Methanobacteriota archaeon]
MIIGVPTNGDKGLDEQVGDHFGRVPTYTLVDTETNKVRVVRNTSEHMGGVGKPPEHLAKEGVNVLLCSGLGPRAITMFEGYGIEVYVGAQGTVRNTIELWKAKKLQVATDENACKEHQH